MKPQRFEIQLDTPDHTFSPGETIAGRVIVDLTEPMTLRNLCITIKGKAYVSWKETSGSGEDETSTHYTASEPYFKTKNYVVGQPDGETMELTAGSYVFPFRFCLPYNIPSSFEITDGHVRYTIKAVIDKPRKRNHVTTMPFTVETPYVLTQPPTPINAYEDERIKTFCCCVCFNMGALEFNVYVPTKSFEIGEGIEAKISINNTAKSVDVTKIELQIEQIVTLYAQRSKEKKYRLLQKVEDCRRFYKTDETVLRLQVPSLPYSKLANCSIIDNDYYLNVIMHFSGCRCPMKKEYPIEIGIKPALNVKGENLNITPAAIPAIHGNKGLPLFPVKSYEPMGTMPMPYR